MKAPGHILRWAAAAMVVVLCSVSAVVAADSAKATAGTESTGKDEWSGVSRVIAIGDLHGSYRKAARLLQGAGLVDRDLHWSGGHNHLVVVGDLLDRGAGDRPLMDLLHRLQPEAESAGGRVHVLLGNHEAMNLMRDLRYVSSLSYRDFAGDETAAERRVAWGFFSRAGFGRQSRGNLSREFQEQFPPGYFARLRSFDPEGEYGSWLLQLPAIVKINDVVYVHGGLTATTAAKGIHGINRDLRDALLQHMEARAVLQAERIVNPLMGYGEIRTAARAVVETRRRIAPEVREAAQRLLDTGDGAMLGADGPLWYRGNAFEDERIEREMIEGSLELLQAKAMVVAHSPTSGDRITSRFHGQLFRVDYNLGSSDKLQALVVEQHQIMVLDATTHQTMRPVRELPTGRSQPAGLIPDVELQEFLAQAEITDSRELGRGRTRPLLLELEKNGETRRGIFKTIEQPGGDASGAVMDRYEHEVAAYLLDRRIGLNMVPVTILREIDGRRGSLQTWVEGAVDQEAASDYNLDLYHTEQVDSRLTQGAIFDALIGNHDRKPADVLCLVNGAKLFLIDHSRAFSTSAELDWAEDKVLAIDPRLSAGLRSLDRQALDKELGDLLSERQIEALLERRDRILERVVLATADDTAVSRSEPGRGGS